MKKSKDQLATECTERKAILWVLKRDSLEGANPGIHERDEEKGRATDRSQCRKTKEWNKEIRFMRGHREEGTRMFRELLILKVSVFSVVGFLAIA
jgi:hypothetical protein